MESIGQGRFWDRYRTLFNKRGSDWWSIVFGYPLARLLCVPIVRVHAVSPNVLTLASFASKCAAAAMLVWCGGEQALLIVVLLQVNTVLDSMDGTLARARGTFSRLGAFLDKSTDAIGLFAILAALGWVASQRSAEPAWIAVGCAAGAAYLALCYMHWMAIALTGSSGSAEVVAGLASPPSWRQIATEWLRGWLRVLRFQEADLYFWISLFVILGRPEALVALVFATQTIGVVIRLVSHGALLGAADRKAP